MVSVGGGNIDDEKFFAPFIYMYAHTDYTNIKL